MSEIIRRTKLLEKCLADEELARAEYALCRDNIFHFINNWLFTFDPREKCSHKPFTLYDFQHDAIHWLEERYKNKEVGCIEKSRDMGATWLIVSWALHKWIFDNNFTCLFGSKTEGDVDSASVDSIFGKIRYQLYRLPPFLRPNMKTKINDKRDADSYLSIINPVTGNEISGDSANENFGRSGRRSVVFLDEYAFVEQSEKIWSAISEVSNVIIPVSTPNGKGNHFYTLRSKGTIPVLTLHWSRHPHKNQEWYDNKKKTMEPHQVAQELDIDYTSSKAGRVYKRFDRRWHIAKEIIKPNPYLEHFVSWDFGIADNMALVFGQLDVQNNVSIYAEYDLTDQDIAFFLPLVRGSRPPNELWYLLTEKEQLRIDKLLRKVFIEHEGDCLPLNFTHYGDFAGTQRTANSRRSVRDRMKTEGYIDLICTSKQDHATRIQCVDNLLKLRENKSTKEFSSKFLISPDCDRLIDSMMNYVWDKEDIHNPNIKPKHDWSSHFVTAVEFFAINRFPLRSTGSVVVEKFR